MRLIVLTILLCLCSLLSQAQSTDAALRTQSTTEIGQKTYSPTRADAMNQAIIDGKVSILYGATASGTDTYAATVSTSITSYISGQFFLIRFTNANTGASTINLNSIGPIAIQKEGSALVSGDIPANSYKWLAYNGTTFQIIGDGGGGGGGSVNFANNGLSLSGDTVQWSGTLTKPVYVDGDQEINFDLNYSGGDRQNYFHLGDFSNINYADIYAYDYVTEKGGELFLSPFDDGNFTIGFNAQATGNFQVKTGTIPASRLQRVFIDSVGNISMPNTKNFELSGTTGQGAINYQNGLNELEQIFYAGGYDYVAVSNGVHESALNVDGYDFEITNNGSNFHIYSNSYGINPLERLKIDSVGNISMPNTNSFTVNTDTVVTKTNNLETWPAACSDEYTPLAAASTSVPVVTFYIPYGFTITRVFATLTTAGTGASQCIVDIHEDGTTIMTTTKILFSTGQTKSANGTVTDSSIDADSKIEIFLDQRDTDNVATGLKVYIIGHQ